MARVTVRVPDELKNQMERHDEINWSEYVRKSIRERLGNPGSRDIQKLVADYQDEFERLWILHMFSYGTSKRHIYETAETLFDEPLDEVIDEVEADLEALGMENMYKEIDDGMKVGETIQAAIASNGLARIKDHVQEAIQDASREIRDGVSLLALYIQPDIDREYTHIKPDGIERTWSIYSDIKATVDAFIDLGLAYKDRYSSNAYSFSNYVIPDYAMEILEEILEDGADYQIFPSPPSLHDLRALLEDRPAREFLRWMGGSREYVATYDEDDEITDSLDENDIELTLDEFKGVRNSLIEDQVLIIDISPHRSSAGSRSSRPARWIYQLTQPVLDDIPEVLLEQDLVAS